MLRFFAGAGSALLLVTAGFFIWSGVAQDDDDPVPAPPEGPGPPIVAARPGAPPSADERTKEQRRFDRADRDNDGKVTLEELYHPRRRAFARADTNRDGRLSFEEWAVRTATKFGEADADRDRSLTRAEYATTAPRRRTPARPACRC